MPRSDAGVSKRALARIQRLCCLGIGGEMLVPDLMREVAALIPYKDGVFFRLGLNYEISNTYHTFPEAVIELYFKEFFMTDRENSFIKPFNLVRTWPLSQPVRRSVQNLLVDQATFLRSDFYNILWRGAADVHEHLTLCVRENGRIHGLLHIYRAAGDKPFTPNEVTKLEAIAGFVTHGMTRADVAEDAFASSDDRALFVADLQGTVRHAGPEAQHLLTMALNPSLSPTANRRGLGEPIPELLRLCRMLTATASGEIGQPPPVQRLRNPWGEFVLRAYWLGATDGAEQTRRIGITIERRVPRALALRRKVESLPLTAREKQLCLLLARDLSGPHLADGMGLAPSTITTHQRSIYAKLGVHSRAELFRALEPA
jgi:DNA-binding CsgD family transcriptional regulator